MSHSRPLIGVLSPGFPESPAAIVNDLRTSLEAIGLADGTEVDLTCRYALQGYVGIVDAAEELAELEPTLFVGGRSPEARQPMVLRPDIPVIVAAAGDPVGFRLAASLEHPGWNLTGSYLLSDLFAQSRLAVLHALTNASAVGVVWDNTDFERAIEVIQLRRAARAASMRLVEAPLRSMRDLPDAYSRLEKAAVDGVVVLSGLSTLIHAQEVTSAASQSDLVTLFPEQFFLDYGAPVCFNPEVSAGTTMAAEYVAQILGGNQPAELPMRAITQFTFGYDRTWMAKRSGNFEQALPPGTAIVIRDEPDGSGAR